MHALGRGGGDMNSISEGENAVAARLRPVAWLSVPALLLLILALWAADWRTSFESPALLTSLNLVFLTLVSLGIVFLTLRSFLVSALPGLLLLGCGAFFWGMAGLSGMLAAMAVANGPGQYPNILVTLHNTAVWLAALCHLAGAALSLNWAGVAVPAPRRWLAGAALAVPAAAVCLIWMTLAGLTPVFFSPEGGTPVRQLVLGSAIAMLLLTAALLREGSRPRLTPFVEWYSLALALLAVGLVGVLLQPALGSVLSWVSRAAQYLGGGCMLVAALTVARSPRGRYITLGAVRHHPLHTYGIAVAIIIAAAVLRLVFMQSLGMRAAYLTFYPAIAVAALYAGFRAGLLATVLAMALADWFWIAPAGSLRISDPADILSMAVFSGSSLLVCWVVEHMHRAIGRRREDEIEQRRLNRALRLLSECNLSLAREEDERALLSDVCRLVVETGGYLMAWIGFAEQDAGKTVRPVAQSGYEVGYLGSIRISWDEAQDIGRGPAGTAIRTGSTQINHNCLTSPQMLPWREAAIKRGYQSSIALPLVSQGQVLGVLSLYAAAPDAFSAEEVSLLEELARNLAFGIQSLRTRSRGEMAEAATQAKSAFLAHMSHEIRTPMNAILGMAHLMRRDGVTPKQAGQLDQIDASASHLLAIINDILDLSKIEAGKFSLDDVDIAVGALLGNIASILSPQAGEKGLRLVMDTAPLPPHLRGDPTRLTQALLNFANNAVKFTEQGAITLRTRLSEETADDVLLHFEVEDTGCGIAPEQLERLFSAFEQGDASITRAHGGTGLGLAITRHLARLMGGETGASSTPGVGSRFWFTVRLKKGEAPAAVAPGMLRGEAPQAILARDHAGRRVLLAEDDAVNQTIAVELLKDAGLVVDVADNGAQALDLAAVTAYDHDPHGHADAEDGRPGGGAAHPGLAGPGVRAHPGHDRQRLRRRPGTLPGGRHERPPGQAGDAGCSLRECAEVAGTGGGAFVGFVGGAPSPRIFGPGRPSHLQCLSASALRGLFFGDLAMNVHHVHGENLVYEIFQLAGRQGASLGVKDHPLAEHHQGGNGADAEGAGDFLLLFRIQLGEDHVRVFFRGFLEGRREAAAGGAPGGPEIDDDRRAVGDGVVKICRGEFDGGHGRRSFLSVCCWGHPGCRLGG